MGLCGREREGDVALLADGGRAGCTHCWMGSWRAGEGGGLVLGSVCGWGP